jgi:peptide/nickel transport system substrate-binding protein
MKKTYKLTRRQLLRLSALAGTGAVIAACAPAAPSGPSAPEAPAEQQPQQPQPTPAPTVKPVPRDQTIIMGWTVSDFDNTGLTNPFAAGHNHQNFNSALWDPLYYWAAFSDTVYPWLAASEPEYNADFTEVTIKLRDGIEWSDGTPITSKDVVFTVNTWRDNEKLDYHSRVAPYVKEAVAIDDKTVKIIFKQPSPRFVFDVLTVHFDTGRPIVPAHVLEKVETSPPSAADWTCPNPAPIRWCPGPATRRSSTCARTGGRSRPASSLCPR